MSDPEPEPEEEPEEVALKQRTSSRKSRKEKVTARAVFAILICLKRFWILFYFIFGHMYLIEKRESNSQSSVNNFGYLKRFGKLFLSFGDTS